MPATPYVQIKLSVNGGALVEGGQTVAGGDTIDLSAESTVGWKMSPAPEWRLYGFYSNYTAPAGWLTKTITQRDGTTISVYYYLGVTPPQITVQGAGWWGKVNIGLYVDGGVLSDESAGFEVVSPNSLHDLSYREATQFGAGEKWTRDWRANIRVIDTLAGATGATGAAGSGVGWGDGSDGSATISGGTTTLARDMFYTTLTVQNGGILATAGFRVYASTSITVDAGGIIQHNGSNGTAGGSGGSGAVVGSLVAGAAGGNGSATAGATGNASTTSIGGSGGAGGAGAVGAGGAAGTATAPTAGQGGYRTAFSAAFGASFGAGSWIVLRPGGGGGAGGGDGTAGGGGGGGGGAMVLVSPSITNNGTIRVLGGNGGSPGAGNRGGGGGGGGGWVGTVTRTYTGTAPDVSGGTGGTATGTGVNGSNGSAGTHNQALV